jgi:hypothetical protein
MKSIFKNLGLLLVSLVAAYLTASFTGNTYQKLFKDYGSWVDVSSLIGLPLAYIFSLTLLFTAFGGAKKYWWIGIGLIPAVLFEVYFDLQHIYFPLAIGLVAWLLGKGLSLLIEKK